MEAQATNKDAKEEDIFEMRMQMSTKIQPTIMEINMSAPGLQRREDAQPSWTKQHF